MYPIGAGEARRVPHLRRFRPDLCARSRGRPRGLLQQDAARHGRGDGARIKPGGALSLQALTDPSREAGLVMMLASMPPRQPITAPRSFANTAWIQAHCRSPCDDKPTRPALADFAAPPGALPPPPRRGARAAALDGVVPRQFAAAARHRSGRRLARPPIPSRSSMLAPAKLARRRPAPRGAVADRRLRCRRPISATTRRRRSSRSPRRQAAAAPDTALPSRRAPRERRLALPVRRKSGILSSCSSASRRTAITGFGAPARRIARLDERCPSP